MNYMGYKVRAEMRIRPTHWEALIYLDDRIVAFAGSYNGKDAQTRKEAYMYARKWIDMYGHKRRDTLHGVNG